MLALLFSVFLACSVSESVAEANKKCEERMSSRDAIRACKYGVKWSRKGNGKERAKWFCSNYRKYISFEQQYNCQRGVDFYFEEYEKLSSKESLLKDESLAYYSESREHFQAPNEFVEELSAGNDSAVQEL